MCFFTGLKNRNWRKPGRRVSWETWWIWTKGQSKPGCNHSCGHRQRDEGSGGHTARLRAEWKRLWLSWRSGLCEGSVLTWPRDTSMLHLNKQFNNFCTTALFHHSETLHKRNVIKTAFPDSFLHSNICAHSSNYEASLVLTRSLLLALNRIAWLICKASTVTAFGHKAVFFFFFSNVSTVRSIH